MEVFKSASTESKSIVSNKTVRLLSHPDYHVGLISGHQSPTETARQGPDPFRPRPGVGSSFIGLVANASVLALAPSTNSTWNRTLPATGGNLSQRLPRRTPQNQEHCRESHESATAQAKRFAKRGLPEKPRGTQQNDANQQADRHVIRARELVDDTVFQQAVARMGGRRERNQSHRQSGNPFEFRCVTRIIIV